MAPSIAKNTLFMMTAAVGQKLISFAYFIIVAHRIGVEASGKYTAALAFTSIFVVLVDFGFTNIFIRESAKERERLPEYLGVVLGVKIVFAALAYLAMAGAVTLLGYDADIRLLIALGGVTMILDSWHLTLYGTLRTLGNLSYEAIGMVGSQLVTFILGTIFLFAGRPLPYLMLAFLIASAMNVLYAHLILSIRYRVCPRPRVRWPLLKTLARMAAPFALIAIFFRVYSYVDSVMIFKLAGATAAGWYGIPAKIINAFLFIPLALGAATYPRLSESVASDPRRAAHIFEQSIKFLLLVVSPLAFGIIIVSPAVIPLVFGAGFAGSVPPLRILLLSMIFSYLTYPIGACLNALGKQFSNMLIVGIVMVVNVALNVAVITRSGVVGAATTALVSNILLVALGYRLLMPLLPIAHRALVKTAFQILLAVGGMAAVVYGAERAFHVFAAAALGAIAYPFFLYLTRALSLRELRDLMNLLKW